MKKLVILTISALLSSTVAMAQFFDDTPDRDVEMAKRAPNQKPVIPLNPDDPTYNLWKQKRADLSAGREAGPINIQRYPGGFAQQGIPSFFRLPVALTPEDLKAGDVDVAIVGAYTDQGGGMRGGSYGPQSLRTSEVYLPWGVFAGPHTGTQVNPFEILNIVDYGDAPNEPWSTERTMDAVRDIVREMAAVKHEDGRHVIPFIIGGDHSLLYSDAAGITDVYGKGNVGVIHFDAHQDASQAWLGHLYGHGMPIYSLIKEGHVPGKNFIQVGIRGYRPDSEDIKWQREQGFRYHYMAEIERRGWEPVMEEVIKEATDGPDKIYISLDVDILDPAYMPGTGTPEPGGLTPRELFPIIRRLCAETNVVGFELVELNPLVDPTYVSALNGNRLVRECLTGIALRKTGITEPDYLSPLTIDDGL